MPELQRLRSDHAEALLEFELTNRAYFAATVPDRGDDFYQRFAERYNALLADQDAGIGAFHVLVAEDGAVLSRFNLEFVGDGTAQLGYRVAQGVAGRGVATASIQELCRLAAVTYTLRTLRAATARDTVASQTVLAKTWFVPQGPADAAELGGKPGLWYERELTAD